jgi:hypothetical protein
MARGDQAGRRLGVGQSYRAEVDKWEAAHFKEDEFRGKVKQAKSFAKTRCAKSFLASTTLVGFYPHDVVGRFPFARA